MIDLRPHNHPARLMEEAKLWAETCQQLREENARLRNGIEGLANIIRDSIKESDGPDRVWLDGVAYEGPLVDHYFKILHAIQTTFDLLLNKEPTP
jgi:hypothetical protein